MGRAIEVNGLGTLKVDQFCVMSNVVNDPHFYCCTLILYPFTVHGSIRHKNHSSQNCFAYLREGELNGPEKLLVYV